LSTAEVEGDTGVRVDLASLTPSVLQAPSVGEDDAAVAQNVLQGVMSGLQQFGLIKRPGQPRLILFLTNREYLALGSPQINDVLDVYFEDQRIVFRKPMSPA